MISPESAAALGVADEGDDGHEADGDDQPGAVGQALPRHEEGSRQDPQKRTAATRTSGPRPLGNGRRLMSKIGHGLEGEEGEAGPHGAVEAGDRTRAPSSRPAPPDPAKSGGRVGRGFTAALTWLHRPGSVPVAEPPHRLNGRVFLLGPAQLAAQAEDGVLDP